MARSMTFGAAAVIVSLGAHVAAGGTAPDAAGVLVALGVTTCAYRVLLARRERSWAVLTGALACVELVLHAVFMAWSPGCGAGAMADPARGASGWSMPVMVAAHLAAAVVLGGVLRVGEAALWSAARRAVLRWWHPVAATRVGAILAAEPAAPDSRGDDARSMPVPHPLRSRSLATGWARRGPPTRRTCGA